MRKLIILITLLSGYTSFSQESIGEQILSHMESKRVSGLAAVIISEEGIIWEGYYGLADREDSMPVTDSTIFMLASISKTITSTALLQVWEDGFFNLDDPINDYLPFIVANPNYPDDPITFRHLLTHTSSIRDNWTVMESLYVMGDSPIPLGEFMEDYLSATGEYYSPTNNFYNQPPETNYHYSNIGAALCAYLVEAISGQPFNEFCNTRIFDAICMENTGWFLSELNEELIARPYIFVGGEYLDQGLYGYPDYPDGQLRTTARSLSKLLYTHMTNGTLDGTELLEASTLDSIYTIQYPAIDDEQGLMWYTWNRSGVDLWGHNGGDIGVSTDMYFDPVSKKGYVILSNGSAFNIPVLDILMESTPDDWYAEAIPMSCNLAANIVSSPQQESLSVFPNPAQGYTRIVTDDNEAGMYRVTGINGGKIMGWQTVPADGLISTNTWTDGVYLIEWQNKTRTASCVLVVQNH